MSIYKDENGIIETTAGTSSISLSLYGEVIARYYWSYQGGSLRIVSSDGGWDRSFTAPSYLQMEKVVEDIVLVNYLYPIEDGVISDTVLGQKDYLILRQYTPVSTEIDLLVADGNQLKIYHISQDLGDPLYNSDENIVRDYLLSLAC